MNGPSPPSSTAPAAAANPSRSDRLRAFSRLYARRIGGSAHMLDHRSQEAADRLLAELDDAQQQRLLAAMDAIAELLGDADGRQRRSGPLLLRGIGPGDIGWVVSRHGAIYAREYGWNIEFEALVGHIAARFVDRFEPAREAAWIAERDGERLGCVFLVQARDDETDDPEAGVAQLRLLLVEPSARGLGLGTALVDECERFARLAGYRHVRLWTQSILVAARSIYQRTGYQLVGQESHHSFGHDLIGEIWEKELRD